MSIKDELIQYCEDVRYGKIIACKKHKLACKRFERDIEREGTDEFPYIFNNDEAERFFIFSNLFVHTKGVLAGQKIEPHIIHKFIFGNVYGWYHKNTGYRRFNKLYWQVARKQGKSQWMAIVLLYECFCFDITNKNMNECYCFATKTEQAKIVWSEAKEILTRCRKLDGTYTISYGRITHINSGSFIRTLSEEDKKTGDGLNPQVGSNDEYHAQQSSEMYDIVDSGMGARPQPLMCTITTAGFDLANPCYRVEYKLCSDIISESNDVSIEFYFVMINEMDKNETTETIEVNGEKIEPGGLIDNLSDESTWAKSNPINCSYPEGIEYLRKKLIEAQNAPEKMRNFLTKHMNIWVNLRDAGYMDMARWSNCGVSDCNELPVVTGGYKYTPFGCLDMASTTDLCSAGFVFNMLDGMTYVKSHSFMPEEMVHKASERDHVRYDLWISQGWLTATPGAEVDYHLMLEWFMKQYKINGWGKGEVCYDRNLATWLKQELEKKGFTPVDIPQSYTGLSLATKTFRAKVYNRKVIHENDPVLNWSMGNTVIRCGPSENIMLDKSAARFRIDPVAALINGMVRAIANEEKPRGGRMFIV